MWFLLQQDYDISPVSWLQLGENSTPCALASNYNKIESLAEGGGVSYKTRSVYVTAGWCRHRKDCVGKCDTCVRESNLLIKSGYAISRVWAGRFKKKRREE